MYAISMYVCVSLYLCMLCVQHVCNIFVVVCIYLQFMFDKYVCNKYVCVYVCMYVCMCKGPLSSLVTAQLLVWSANCQVITSPTCLYVISS